ncbi:MAG: SUMF1/EgtB/PvdO family nonheme iron enzyme [Planctomycetaceae bacterium]
MITRHDRGRWHTTLLVLAAAAATSPALAQVTFDWATVGNPGNAPDTLVMNKPNGTLPGDGTTGYGSVDYTYRISKYDVTNSQYVSFLNTVDPNGTNSLLYITNMTNTVIQGVSYPAYSGGIDRNLAAAAGSRYSVMAGQENYPVVHINWSRAARFVNWLANGQGSGGTESGVYDMSVFGGTNYYAAPPPRAPGAQVFLPSEDEWYKAAYYDPSLNGGLGGFWQYGTRNNAAPASVGPPGSSNNSANIGAGTSASGGSSGSVAATFAKTGTTFDINADYLTNVGAYTTSISFFGLSDLDGLVYNWTEASRESLSTPGHLLPVYRGGSWYYNELNSGAALRSTSSYAGTNTGQFQYWGFRVASLAPVGPTAVTIDVTTGTSQTQAQAGYPTLTPDIATSVTKTGGGTLVLDQANTLSGSTTVQGGVLRLANASALSASQLVVVAGGTAQVTPVTTTSVASLDLASGNGLLDLTSGALTIAGGMTGPQLVAEILEGRGDGSWTGTSGIVSSVAAAEVASSIPRAVGWVDNGDGSLTAAYAAPGDTNIDWSIDILDASNFLALGKFDTGLPATWIEGDFSYDGIVDILDAADFFATGLYDAGNYNAGDSAAGVAAVPEPTAWALMGLAGVRLLWRPRRRAR